MADPGENSVVDPALESAMPPGTPPVKTDDGGQRAMNDIGRTMDIAAERDLHFAQAIQQAYELANQEVAEGGAAEEDQQQPTAMTSTYRRNANGSVSSVFSGNRIRYLKKEDGHPLWRKDIQYLFLRMVFEDENKVFTRFSDGSTGHTFADIYIDAMAKSSKTSQILKEKLLSDRESALQMAMICLLVNVGRMNTTLNCRSSSPHSTTEMLILHSFSRNACSCTHLSRYSLFTGAIGHRRIQTITGWTPSQVNTEGCYGRHTAAWKSGRAIDDRQTAHQPSQLDLRVVPIRSSRFRNALLSTTRLL